MKSRRAIVKLDGVLVGRLEDNANGVEFRYEQSWLENPNAVPVSFTLPLRAEPYLSHSLHPFFENLLPEGWLLEIATTKLKIAKDDAFGLLIATCADCVGAVEILSDEART